MAFKGHEPSGEMAAGAYGAGDESSMPGRALVRKKTHKMGKRHGHRGKRKMGKRG